MCLTDAGYNDEIYEGRTKPFAVVFVSDTCPHCQSIEAIMEKIEADPDPTTMVFRYPERGAEEMIMGRLGSLKYILAPVIIKEWMEEAR